MVQEKEMTDNEIGYKVYLWEQAGYRFIPLKYNPNKDYTKYLNYFYNPSHNERLIKRIKDECL